MYSYVKFNHEFETAAVKILENRALKIETRRFESANFCEIIRDYSSQLQEKLNFAEYNLLVTELKLRVLLLVRILQRFSIERAL